MATLRQYYETDFPNCFRIFGKLEHQGENFEIDLCHDFTAHARFAVAYIQGNARSNDSVRSIIKAISSGGQLEFSGKAVLPAAKTFLGRLRIENKPNSIVDVGATLLTSPREFLSSELHYTSRLFLYCESMLDESVIGKLMDEAKSINVNLQIRTPDYEKTRSNMESPLAFISHDTRDKNDVARPIVR